MHNGYDPWRLFVFKGWWRQRVDDVMKIPSCQNKGFDNKTEVYTTSKHMTPGGSLRVQGLITSWKSHLVKIQVLIIGRKFIQRRLFVFKGWWRHENVYKTHCRHQQKVSSFKKSLFFKSSAPLGILYTAFALSNLYRYTS